MRSVLALALFIALTAAADGAGVHPHYRTYHHVFTRHAFIPPGVGSSFDAMPGWRYQPPRLPKFYDDTPSYDDPSKLGSG